MEAETVTAPGDVPVFDMMPAVLTAVLVSLIAYFGHGPLHELLFQTSTKTKSLGADSDDESDVSSDKCIVKRLEEEEKNCVVLFGSQSGNAQEFAEKLGREAHIRFSLHSIVAEIDDYTYQNLHKLPENTIVFFILASYGDGEPTDNSEQFYNFLTDEDDDGPFDRLREHGLQNLSYSAFGLGNRSYAHFNAVVRKVDERLQLCGARRLGPVGEADDGKGTNAEDFIEWKDKMWPQVMEAFGLVERDAGEREPAFEVVEIPNHHGPIFQADYTDRNLAQQAQAVTNHCFAPISDSKLLSDAGGRSYIHVELDIKNTKLDYETGDHLSVSPINSDIEVERFLRVFGLWDKRHETIRVRSLSDDLNPPFPSPCSYESAARFYIDICGPVSREVVSAFANSVSNAKQKTTLRQLGKDKEAFLALTEGSYYNVASMMETLFPGETVDVPFAIIIEAMPKLQPRYYSISSSSALDAGKVSITVAIESFPIQKTNRHFSGVATNFILDAASTGNEVLSRSRMQPIPYTLTTKRPHLQASLSTFVRTSTFRLPSDPTIPILMFGPGTGVAPFRGFVRERVAMHRQGTSFAPMTLFNGCRKRTEDFLYEKEWKAYASELGSKFRMYTAFSREQKHKVYVQDLILQQSKDIASLIQNGGHVYVCGDVGMGRGVTETLCKVLASETMQLRCSQLAVAVSSMLGPAFRSNLRAEVRRPIELIASVIWRPFDERFGVILSSMSRHQQQLNDEVNIYQLELTREAATASEEIYKDTQATHACVSDLQEHVRLQTREQAIARIQSWLNAPNFASTYWNTLDECQEDTAQWIFEMDKFQEWSESLSISSTGSSAPESRLLWIYGNPGGGKSVLTASIVHELSSCNQNLVYFFFKEQSPFHTASDLAFRAILAQILHKHKHNDDMLDKFIFASNHGDKSSGQSIATPAELRDLLHLCLSSIRNPIMILDGIDECTEPDGFVKYLSSLLALPNLRALFSSRPTVQSLTKLVPLQHRLSFGQVGVEHDLETYCHYHLTDLFDDGLLLETSDIQYLTRRLVLGADRMFLWAKLMFSFLRSPALNRRLRENMIHSITLPEGLGSMELIDLYSYCSVRWLYHLGKAVSPRTSWRNMYYQEMCSTVVKGIVDLLRRLLENPLAVAHWIDCFYTSPSVFPFWSSTGAHRLRFDDDINVPTAMILKEFSQAVEWLGWVQKLQVPDIEAKVFLYLSDNLARLREDLTDVCKKWDSKLSETPAVIWSDVLAFTSSKYLPAAQSTYQVPIDSGTPSLPTGACKRLCHISATSSDGSVLGILSIWPSRKFEKFWETIQPSTAYMEVENYCDNWHAVYELSRVGEPMEKLGTISIPLKATEVALQMRQAFRQEHLSTWKASFPFSISFNGYSICVLRTIYRVTIDPVLSRLRIRSCRMPLEEITRIQHFWDDRLKRHDPSYSLSIGLPPTLQLLQRKLYTYRAIFDAHSRYVFFQDAKKFEAPLLAVFEVNDTPSGELQVRVVAVAPDEIMGPWLGCTGIPLATARFHPKSSLVVSAVRGRVMAWDFSINTMSHLSTDGAEVKSLSISTCANYVVVMRENSDSHEVYDLTKRNLNLTSTAENSPGPSGSLMPPHKQQKTHSSHEGHMERLDSRMEVRHANLSGSTFALAGGNGNSTIINAGPQNIGSQLRIDAGKIKLTAPPCMTDTAAKTLELLSIPSTISTQDSRITLYLPNQDDNHLSLLVDKGIEDGYNMMDKVGQSLPVLVRKDKRLVREAIKSATGQKDERIRLVEGAKRLFSEIDQ
ncbi:unnamed protein product [Fusarium fujikuroi]|nr:unnamed protein product [Fusarium fujikuroi]